MQNHGSVTSCINATPSMILDADELGLRFSWHGGAYVEIGAIPGGEPFQAVEVINVWDDEAGASLVPVTLDGFRAECERYVRTTVLYAAADDLGLDYDPGFDDVALAARVADGPCDGLGTGIGADGYFACAGCAACADYYPRCEKCGDPIDYCQGHGSEAS